MSSDNRGPELAAVTGLLLGLSVITVSLRCYVRIFMLKVFRPEDWLAVGTLGLFILYAIFVILSIEYGAGRHLDTVPKEYVPRVLKMRWAGEITYVATGTALKLTVGIFLLRLCSQTWHKVTICAVLVVCVGFNIFYAFIATFQCRPIQYFWERYTNDTITGSCFPGRLVTGLTYAACGINAVGDWILGLLPILLVQHLNLVKRQKISVAGILALGAVASTATIVRLFYVWQLAHEDDTLYKFTDLAIWSTVENGLGLTASSIATLRPLFKSFLGVARLSLSRKPPTGRNVLRRRSRIIDLHDLDPDPDTGGRVHEPTPRRPTRPVALALRPPSDDGSDDSVPLTLVKSSWKSCDGYQLNREALARHYYPISPREARARWHSDGSRYYRRAGGREGGGGGGGHAHLGTHGRQSSI